MLFYMLGRLSICLEDCGFCVDVVLHAGKTVDSVFTWSGAKETEYSLPATSGPPGC